MSGPTQTERVIKAARSYRGITQVDFLLPGVVDGGTPITRVGARLFDAEQMGYSFECIGRRDKCKAWRLLSEPEVERGSAVRAAPETVSDSSPLAASGEVSATLSLSPEPLFSLTEETAHWRSEAA